MKKRFAMRLIFAFLIFFITGIGYAQTPVKDYFTVDGEVLKTLQINVDDLSKMKQEEISTKDRDGKSHIYKGVRLADILITAGVTLGKELRGENLIKYVLLKAVDGYEVIFALAEADPELSGHTIILAYMVDGNLLPKGEGPFRILAPNDKRQARWVRELQSIRILFPKN